MRDLYERAGDPEQQLDLANLENDPFSDKLPWFSLIGRYERAFAPLRFFVSIRF